MRDVRRLARRTGAFTIVQFAKVGVVVTVAGWLLIVLLSATYWPMIGVL